MRFPVLKVYIYCSTIYIRLSKLYLGEHRVTDALLIAVTSAFNSIRHALTMSKLITKIPHGEGHTSMAFSKDGK